MVGGDRGKLRGDGHPQIADRLDAFRSLLELVETNPYPECAYRRTAETVRGNTYPWWPDFERDLRDYERERARLLGSGS